MTIAAVADTHAALWFLLKVPRPSTTAKAPIDDAAARQHTVAISSISMIEVVYLIEKGRIPSSAYTELLQSMADPLQVFSETPVTSAIAGSMRFVSRQEIPGMPDRIMAATALHVRS
jgi:PIN domain nuclease of toxin-antitoxin system